MLPWLQEKETVPAAGFRRNFLISIRLCPPNPRREPLRPMRATGAPAGTSAGLVWSGLDGARYYRPLLPSFGAVTASR